MSTPPDPQRARALLQLHEQAQRAAQDLALALQRANAELAQAENKQRTLLQFAEQYRRQLCELEQRGGAWSQVRDLRAFLDRLGAAQAAQRADIDRARARCLEQQRAWTATRQREKAFEVLLAQEQGLAAAHQRNLMQRDLDEWSTNRPGFADSRMDGFADSQVSRLPGSGSSR